MPPFEAVVNLRADAVSTLTLDLEEVGLHATIRHARGWLQPIGGRLEHAVSEGESRFTITVPVTGAQQRTQRRVATTGASRQPSVTTPGGTQ